jgi:hypothetical protein
VSLPRGGLARSLAALSIAPEVERADRASALSDTATGEYEQQVHVPLSGVAAPTPAFIDAPVAWELPFLYAPLQRRVPFPTPHFTCGIEHTAGTGQLVLIHAHVIAWTVTESQWYVGATVRFDVSAPLAIANSPYAAIAHLSFSGFGTLAEAEEFSN